MHPIGDVVEIWEGRRARADGVSELPPCAFGRLPRLPAQTQRGGKTRKERRKDQERETERAEEKGACSSLIARFSFFCLQAM